MNFTYKEATKTSIGFDNTILKEHLNVFMKSAANIKKVRDMLSLSK